MGPNEEGLYKQIIVQVSKELLNSFKVKDKLV